jgi:hypothetical protein
MKVHIEATPSIALVLALSLLVIAGACATPAPEPALTAESPSPITPDFDVESFASINPNPEIREFDPNIDFGFDERARLDRDAIEPIYTPKFVSPADAELRTDEIVMGLVINGDVRAYPTGLLRAREMVNDEVGGTPVLVTW